MNETKLTTSSTERRYGVHKKDLPLSCPTAQNESWNAHPRVFLDIEDKGEALCPYCGALYVLLDTDS